VILVLSFGALAGLALLWLTLLLGIEAPGTGASRLAELDAARGGQRAVVDLTRDRRQQYEQQSLRALGAGLRTRLETRGFKVPAGLRTNLAVVGRSVDAHLGLTLVATAAGAAVPLFTVGAFALIMPGLRGMPLGVAVVLGAVLGLVLPSLVVASRAADRRRDFRHVIGSFLDLVAMNLSGGRGIPEALDSTSSLSGHWAMVRIRDALQLARLHGVAPWTALGRLGEDMGVEELRDLAAALALVADDGAKVRDSLAARAASLRRRELAETEGRAQARSQSMLVAQLLLAAGFLIFLIYPALAKVLG
jgi:tight adherence protein C